LKIAARKMPDLLPVSARSCSEIQTLPGSGVSFISYSGSSIAGCQFLTTKDVKNRGPLSESGRKGCVFSLLGMERRLRNGLSGDPGPRSSLTESFHSGIEWRFRGKQSVSAIQNALAGAACWYVGKTEATLSDEQMKSVRNGPPARCHRPLPEPSSPRELGSHQSRQRPTRAPERAICLGPKRRDPHQLSSSGRGTKIRVRRGPPLCAS